MGGGTARRINSATETPIPDETMTTACVSGTSGASNAATAPPSEPPWIINWPFHHSAWRKCAIT